MNSSNYSKTSLIGAVLALIELLLILMLILKIDIFQGVITIIMLTLPIILLVLGITSLIIILKNKNLEGKPLSIATIIISIAILIFFIVGFHW